MPKVPAFCRRLRRAVEEFGGPPKSTSAYRRVHWPIEEYISPPKSTLAHQEYIGPPKSTLGHRRVHWATEEYIGPSKSTLAYRRVRQLVEEYGEAPESSVGAAEVGEMKGRAAAEPLQERGSFRGFSAAGAGPCLRRGAGSPFPRLAVRPAPARDGRPLPRLSSSDSATSSSACSRRRWPPELRAAEHVHGKGPLASAHALKLRRVGRGELLEPPQSLGTATPRRAGEAARQLFVGAPEGAILGLML